MKLTSHVILLILLLFATLLLSETCVERDTAVFPQLMTKCRNDIQTSTRLKQVEFQPVKPVKLAVQQIASDILPASTLKLDETASKHDELFSLYDPSRFIPSILALINKKPLGLKPLETDFTMGVLGFSAHSSLTLPPVTILPVLQPPSEEFASLELPVLQLPSGEFTSLELPVLQPPSGEFASLLSCQIVYQSLIDDTLNPRSPLWRPQLAQLLNNPKVKTSDSEQIFAFILAGCPGATEQARIKAAETWAKNYNDGKYLNSMAFAAARHAFSSGEHTITIARCNQLLDTEYPYPDKVLGLMALAEAYTGDTDKALATIKLLRNTHPSSPTLPEAMFMEAWIALQQQENESASEILNQIITKYPGTRAASRAATMLKSVNTQYVRGVP